MKQALFFSWDRLTMYDGGSMTSPMIGLYCDSTPLDIITTGNEIFVHFYTSPSYTDIGFKLMYNPTSNQDKLQFCENPNFWKFKCRF